MSVFVRLCTVDDIDLLQQISKKTFYETFAHVNSEENMQKYLNENLSVGTLTAELNNEGSEFYFAGLNNEVIGYLKVNHGKSQTELKLNNALEIERIYVLKEFHGKNVGQFLYEHALQIARDKQADYIWLGVWEENKRAISFYKKNGFEEFDKHIFKLGDDKQTDIMMKLRLNGDI